MKYHPLYMTDSYKLAHADMYPDGTQFVYSNFTPRSNKRALEHGYPETVKFFGLRAALVKLHEAFAEWFTAPFNVAEFDDLKPFYNVEKLLPRFEALHRLGYLPIDVRAIPERSQVPMGVPVFTVMNTHPDFYWVVNYLETYLSSQVWHPTTSATIAAGYKTLMERYADKTCDNAFHVPYQCHDFSYRGHHGVESAAMSGAGHLLSFAGTDSLPAVQALRQYYGDTREVIGCSVPATEHSVMCAGGEAHELETFRRLIQLYPTGILSVVSDTWDYFNTISVIAKSLKDEICARTGKLVFRPDSGDPLKIICGNPESADSLERQGSLNILWEVFGGTVNDKGYKVLNDKVGLIYGDSITYKRAEAILAEMERQGFASSNIVFGIGSYTYVGSVTRDTYSFAMKATAVCIDGAWSAICKNPKTAGGDKKSATGFLHVDANMKLVDNIPFTAYQTMTDSVLEPVYTDGVLKY